MTISQLRDRLARRGWWLYLVVQGTLVALLAVLPRDRLWVSIELANTILVVLAVVAGILLHRPRPVGPLVLVAAGIASYGAANAVSFPAWAGLIEPLPFPGPADAAYLAGYGLIIAGVAALGLVRRGVGRIGDITDSLVLALGFAALLWEPVVKPYLQPDSGLEPFARLIAASYSLADVGLLGVVAWLALRGFWRSVSAILGLAYVGLQLAADVVYGTSLNAGTFDLGSLATHFWALSFLFLGTAALHPSVVHLGRSADGVAAFGRRRVAALGLAAMVGPVVTFLDATGGDPSTSVVASLSAVIVALVVVRVFLLTVDVAAYRQVNADLDTARSQYQDLVERVPAVTWAARIVADGDGRTEKLYVNPEVATLSGHADSDFLTGRAKWSDVVHPDDRDAMAGRFRDRIRAILAQPGSPGPAEAFADEYRIIRADGVQRWVRDEDRIVRDADGTAVEVHGVVLDITERHEAEERLRASEARFRALVEQLPGVVFVNEVQADGSTRAVYVSARSTEVLGWTPERILAEPAAWRSIIHPDDIAAAARERGRHTATGETASVEVRLAADDPSTGSERWIHVTWTKVGDLDADGCWLSQGLALDVTGRRRVQEELERLNEDLDRRVTARTAELSEARGLLQETMALSPGAIFAGRWDPGELTYVSDYVGVLLGVDGAAFPRTFEGLLALVHPDDIEPTGKAVRAAFEARSESLDYEFRARRPDGEERWLLVRQHNRYAPDGTPDAFVGVAIDIDERKRVEAALAAAREEAERATRAKSEFLSSVSHELRTPLNAILGFGQLLEASPLAEADRESATEIVRAGRNLLAMIDDVLEFSRLDAGRISLSIEPVEVGPLVREAIDLARPAFEERGVGVVDLVPPDSAVVVLADRRRLGQVLLNLLSNAAKYNRAGGSASVGVVRTNGRARIVVDDTGIGIEPTHLARIFEPFEPVGRDRGPRRSIGLGLALSARLAQLMGGSLTATSEVGVGSTFTVELPLASPPEPRDDDAPGVVDGGEGEATAERATILYIEDNLANLHLVERILTSSRAVRMLAAMQGRLGLELAREHAPDLILLDLHLPDVEPEETLRGLKADERTRDIPVVVLSSESSAALAREMVALGARDFVAKPFDIARLLRVVDEVLAGR